MPRTAYSPRTNGKVEVQNKHLTNFLRHFISKSGSNWSEYTSKFSFSHNTAVNYSTGYTPYGILFGTKPQIPLSLKLGLLRDNQRNAHQSIVVIYHHTRIVKKLVITKR